MLDQYLPKYDTTEAHAITVDAEAQETYGAIKDTDLRDPIIASLFFLRELPLRIARRWRGEPAPATDRAATILDLIKGAGGWVVLEETPGSELVVGAIGRFWRKNYDARAIAPEDFGRFAEPGYAKLVVSFAIAPMGPRRTRLRYEARTATTDAFARRRFGAYWRLIRPGVALVMTRVLRRIKRAAEQTTGAAQRES